MDRSVETLKALAAPRSRPGELISHLERQAEAITKMQTKIRDQLRRLQIEETFLKKKLSATPINNEEPEQSEEQIPTPVKPAIHHDSSIPADSMSTTDAKKDMDVDEDEDFSIEEMEDEDITDFLKSYRSSNKEDDEMYSSEEEDENATLEIKRILASKYR